MDADKLAQVIAAAVAQALAQTQESPKGTKGRKATQKEEAPTYPMGKGRDFMEAFEYQKAKALRLIENDKTPRSLWYAFSAKQSKGWILVKKGEATVPNGTKLGHFEGTTFRAAVKGLK